MKILHLNAPSPYYTNSFLVISEKGNAVIIDASANENLYNEALKENNAKLVAILQTHGHKDHVYTVNTMRNKTGATVYIGAADDKQFKLNADKHFTDREIIEIDELRFEIIATPGHTRGSCCIKVGSLLFTGDTLFCGDVGRTDLEGGNYDELMKSLQKLCKIVQDNPQVLPGHEMFSDMDSEKRNNRYLKR